MEEVAKENDEIKKEAYLNRETLEVLTDAVDISYYKNLQADEIIENQLLGQFDGVGDYHISKDILLELVSVKKHIKESKDNKYILSAPTKEGFDELIFTLQIEDDGDKKLASLKLVETDTKIDETKEYLKTIIARYKDDDDVYFIVKVKKVFNIVDIVDGDVINNEELLNIILKKFKGFKALKNEGNKFENLSKEYIEKILEILKNNPGNYLEYILRRYGIILEEMKDLVGKPKYYRSLRDKLDKVIDQTNKRVKDPVITPLINDARKELLVQTKKNQDIILNPAPVVAKTISKEKPKEKKAEDSGKKPKKAAAKKKVEAKKKVAKKAEVRNNPTFKPQPKEVIKTELTKVNKIQEKVDDIKVDSNFLLSNLKVSQVKLNQDLVSGDLSYSQKDLNVGIFDEYIPKTSLQTGTSKVKDSNIELTL